MSVTPEPLEILLSDADDRLLLNHWLPPQEGIVPRVRRDLVLFRSISRESGLVDPSVKAAGALSRSQGALIVGGIGGPPYPSGGAEGHGRDPDLRISVEGGTVYPKPAAQAVAGGVVERQAALMHASTGGLSADQKPRFRLHPHHRPRFVSEFASARATGADIREQGL